MKQSAINVMSSYIGYWYRFGEQHPNLFKDMSSKLPDTAKNESESSSPDA
jgi:hypothetical protein